MIALLSRLFIRDRENYSSPTVRRAYGMLCGGVGIILNILLFAGKFLAGTIAKSVAVTADAFNNLADAGSSIITIIGFKLSGQKPDPEHPFGHGRIEYISGLLVSAAIILMGVELLKSSVEKIVNPTDTVYTTLTMIILAVSIATKLYMTLYNRRMGKKVNSTSLMATSADSLSDSIATGVVLLSAIVSKLFGLRIDGWCGLLVALFVLYSGVKSVKETIAPLLGQIPDAEFVANIESIVLSYDGISAVHDLIVHDYGPGRMIVSLHAEMPVNADSDIFEMHDVIDNAERRLRDELGCDATIHMDPVAEDDEATQMLKAHMLEALKGIDSELHMHDFRIVPGPTHTNLIFDVVVPFGFRLSDDEVKRILSNAASAMSGGRYYTVVTIDRPFV